MFNSLKWTLVLMAVAAVIIGGLKLRLDTVTAQLAETKRQMAILENQLNEQNAAITQWQVQANVEKQRLAAAEHKAQKQANTIPYEEQKTLAQKIAPGC